RERSSSWRPSFCRTRRSMHGQEGVEQHTEGAERLPSPLWPKSQKDDVTRIKRHIERRGFASQIFLANEISREKRRARLGVSCQDGSFKPLLNVEDRATVDENRRLCRHPCH